MPVKFSKAQKKAQREKVTIKNIANGYLVQLISKGKVIIQYAHADPLKGITWGG